MLEKVLVDMEKNNKEFLEEAVPLFLQIFAMLNEYHEVLLLLCGL